MKKLTTEEMAFLAMDSNSVGAGYVNQLVGAGYVNQLVGAGYFKKLVDAGYVNQLVDAGYFKKLVGAGYVNQLVGAGYFNQLVDAGYVNQLVDAGYVNQLVDAIPEWNEIPDMPTLYTTLFSDIQNKIRFHQQSTWGVDKLGIDDFDPSKNACGTAMCTAGHITHKAGVLGFKMIKKYGVSGAASIIHAKTHPGLPKQNFGSINQELALAYIQYAAKWEKENLLTN